MLGKHKKERIETFVQESPGSFLEFKLLEEADGTETSGQSNPVCHQLTHCIIVNGVEDLCHPFLSGLPCSWNFLFYFIYPVWENKGRHSFKHDQSFQIEWY